MKRYISLIAFAVLFFTLGATLPQSGKILEKHWQTALNDRLFGGKLEVVVSAGRVDILTDEYAVEVDKVTKYKEGIAQALRYAKATSKKPLLALYIDGHKNGHKKFIEAIVEADKHGVSVILINDYVGVNDLVNIVRQPDMKVILEWKKIAHWTPEWWNIPMLTARRWRQGS